MYVNRPVTPAYYQTPIGYPGPGQVATAAAPAPVYSPYNTSQATSDVMYNIKALATNVWTWLKGFLQSAMTTLKAASAPHS